jgi:hypothetical protein
MLFRSFNSCYGCFRGIKNWPGTFLFLCIGNGGGDTARKNSRKKKGTVRWNVGMFAIIDLIEALECE